jgi:hypothetical protein
LAEYVGFGVNPYVNVGRAEQKVASAIVQGVAVEVMDLVAGLGAGDLPVHKNGVAFAGYGLFPDRVQARVAFSQAPMVLGHGGKVSHVNCGGAAVPEVK